MDASFQFIFRWKMYRAEFFLDTSDFPCHVFVILRDPELTQEFGEEVTLRTDFENLLSGKNDFLPVHELRATLFSLVKSTAYFIAAKEEWKRTASKSAVKSGTGN